MAKKNVQAKTPQKTDELGINDIINQKIAVPAGQTLTYFPITGAVASASAATHGPLFVLDSSPETYWQPSDQVAGAHIELTTPNAYECYGVDIKFRESENIKFNLKVDVLDKVGNRWLTVATAESSLIDDNKYERFQAAQHFKADTYRIIINSAFDTTTGHLSDQPKIAQVRIFGLVPNEDVAKYKKDITSDVECPDGYGKDAESGLCVKSIPSEIIKPKTIDAKSGLAFQEPAGNDPENLLTVNPNDKLTLKGNDSYIEYGLDQNDKVYAVYINKLNNPVRQYTLSVQFYKGENPDPTKPQQPFYSFVVDMPDTQDKYVHILNEPLRADRFRLNLIDNTEPNQLFSLLGLYLIGQPNAGPDTEEPEPPIPKSCSIKSGGWGSASDSKPEEWTPKEMTDKNKKGKWKGVGKDGKNVFHDCDSEQDAKDFIKRKIWESKQTEPPTEPPVEPPGPGTGTNEVDSFGVKKIYPDASSKRFLTNNDVEFKVRHYASGAPNDNSTENTIDTKDKKFRDMEATVVIVNKGMEHHDRFSYKLRGPGHQDGKGWWYIFEVSTDGKWTNESFQTEKPHPKYFKQGNKITPVAQIGKNDLRSAKIGIKAITINKTINGKEAVHLEQWLNHDPITADGKPNNAGWFKHMEVDDVGQFENGLMLECNGTLVTMRIDGILTIDEKQKDKLPEFYFTSVREIQLPTGTTNPPPTEPPVPPTNPPTNPPTEPPVPPTNPPVDPNAKVDAQGVVMIYAPKVGGQVVIATETNQKESEHNTGTRTSLYSNKPYSANSGELTEGFIMNLSDNGEQNAPKLLSGGHTGSGDNDETRQGQCYAVGVNQNGSLHLAKEYPHHPTTPKAYDKIQYLDPNWKNLGSIKNKKVFMKIIYFPVKNAAGKEGMHMEWWFDKKALSTGKLENDWVQMAFAEDFGDWGKEFGPPHMVNNGVKYKGKILGFYIRIDTPTKPVEFSHQGMHELDSPPRKLVGIPSSTTTAKARSIK